MKKFIVIALSLVSLLAIVISGSIFAITEEYAISNAISIIVNVADSIPSGGGGIGNESPVNIGSLNTGSNGYVWEDTSAKSTDSKTTCSIDRGTTALDRNGNPLKFVKIEPVTNPPALPQGENIVGIPYEFTPNGATFNPAITITFKYNPSSIPSDTNLKIVFWNGMEWIELTDVVVDASTGIVSGKTTHFTKFALITVPKPIVTTTKPMPTVEPTVTTPVVTTTTLTTTIPTQTTTKTSTTTTVVTTGNNTTPTIVPTSPTTSLTSLTPIGTIDNGLGKGAIALIIFGIAVVIIVIVVATVIGKKKKQ